jgi:hypothetical protein
MSVSTTAYDLSDREKISDRFDKRFGRALDYNFQFPRLIDQAAELNFVPTKTVEFTAALEEVRRNDIA